LMKEGASAGSVKMALVHAVAVDTREARALEDTA